MAYMRDFSLPFPLIPYMKIVLMTNLSLIYSDNREENILVGRHEHFSHEEKSFLL